MTIEIKIGELELKYKDEFSSLEAHVVENLLKLLVNITKIEVKNNETL